MARTKTITVFQTFPDKKQPQYAASIIKELPAHLRVKFINDIGETVERTVNRGACSISVKPKKTV